MYTSFSLCHSLSLSLSLCLICSLFSSLPLSIFFSIDFSSIYVNLFLSFIHPSWIISHRFWHSKEWSSVLPRTQGQLRGRASKKRFIRCREIVDTHLLVLELIYFINSLFLLLLTSYSLFLWLSFFLSDCLAHSFALSLYLYIYVYQSIYPCVHLSFFVCIYLSVYLPL